MATRPILITPTASDIKSVADPDLESGTSYISQNRGNETIFWAETTDAPTDTGVVHSIPPGEYGVLDITDSPFWAWCSGQGTRLIVTERE